ncbi:hypothetical protein MO867_11550 [Microbulbifer sp. OS29]|uniref:Morphogenetic protein n=1 Tax=Microbulbifer okhotskensis TaxID=2926617 RepID=A0A9X2ESK2_9GAMM|nr:hypothetical protein [Microbulbifer okhotskensis]MCO1334971.1 hypothetical protein [Microbulbifer okhotskensis]
MINSVITEKPILFNGDMVRAILDGRKTQMRRPIKPQPFNGLSNKEAIKQIGGLPAGRSLYQEINSAWQSRFVDINCPLGEPGDRLWVREAWKPSISHSCAMDICDCGDVQVEYLADGSFEFFRDDDIAESWTMPKSAQEGNDTPSIHMPRWASRIHLEITYVRVERIQDISEADAKAEGVDGPESAAAQFCGWYEKPLPAFRRLWESIYSSDSWDQNPWVWVVEFRRIEQQIGVAA